MRKSKFILPVTKIAHTLPVRHELLDYSAAAAVNTLNRADQS